MRVYLKKMSGEILPMELGDDVETADEFLEGVYGYLGDNRWRVFGQTEGELKEITFEDESLEIKGCVFCVMRMDVQPYEVAIQLSSPHVYNMMDDTDRYQYYDIAVIRDEGETTLTTIQGMYVKEEDNRMYYYREDEETIPAYRMGHDRDGNVEWGIEITSRAVRYDTLESWMKGSRLEDGLTESEAEEQREKIMEEWRGMA